MAGDSRDRMVRSAAALIRARGLSATSFSDVLADSGAPRGSIYHHFPGGKKELAAGAVRLAGQDLLAGQRACPAGTPAGVLDWFLGLWAGGSADGSAGGSGGGPGCTLAGAVLDTDPVAERDADLLELVRATFRSWTDLLGEQLAAAGLPAERARAVAVTALAGVQGALILCRAEGTLDPLTTVAAELARLTD